MEKKVLVIDDTIANLDLIISFLGRNGYKCFIAKNGFDGIIRAEKNLPDIILLDIQMPEMDGFETCLRLKKSKKAGKIPVIFMTALTETPDKVRGFEVGGVDYITKPIDTDELLARIQTHLTIHNLKKELEISLKAKNKLLKSNEEKSRELIKTQNELFKNEKMASLGYLVSGIAHELGTPLSIGITSSSMIKEETALILKKLVLDDPEINRSFSSIITCNDLIFNNLNKIGYLIKKFKKLSVFEGGIKSEFELKEHIESCIKTTKSMLNAPPIDIKIHGDKLTVNMDIEVIEKIIKNLFENSVVHGLVGVDDKKIVINIVGKTGNLKIDYMDNGIGIEESVISNIFDPFFTTSKSKGTGLGLSIVYNLVTQLLNGDIIYKNDNYGSHFIITCPLN